MVAPRKKSSNAKDWALILSAPDRFEAPDWSFIGHRDIVTRSLARYQFVAPHLYGATLDVGCGRGYGFEAIKPHSTVQTGIDVSYQYLREAQDNFPTTWLVCAEGSTLPLSDDAFDSIIAFEVIEHIEDDLAFLDEIRRLARENAFIAISTPNKLAVSGNATKPLNPFHIREYTSREFHNLLSQVFSSVVLFGQYERSTTNSLANRLIDLIPMRWKYLLPAPIQGLVSVMLRPPLRLDECRFQAEDLDNAHTFVAFGRP